MFKLKGKLIEVKYYKLARMKDNTFYIALGGVNRNDERAGNIYIERF